MLAPIKKADIRWIDSLVGVPEALVRTPVIDGDSVLISRSWRPPGKYHRSDLRALNTEDGSERWSHEIDSLLMSVDATEDTIWWVDFWETVRLFDHDGTLRSSVDLPRRTERQPRARAIGAAGDRLIVALDDSEGIQVLWLDRAGQVVGQHDLNGRTIRGRVCGDRALLGLQGDTYSVVELDATTHAQRWASEVKGWVADIRVARDEAVIFGGSAPTIIGPDGGATRWLDGTGLTQPLTPPCEAHPMLVKNRHDDSVMKVVALDIADGPVIRWSHELAKQATAGIVVEDTALVLSADGLLTALDIETGEAGWTLRLGAKPFGYASTPVPQLRSGSLALAGQTLIVAQNRSVGALALR